MLHSDANTTRAFVGGRFQARSEQYIFYLTIIYFGRDNQILQSQFCNVLGLSDVEAE